MLENEKLLVIDPADYSSSNKCVQGLLVCGKNADRYLVAHNELIKGGFIKFKLWPTSLPLRTAVPNSPFQHRPQINLS